MPRAETRRNRFKRVAKSRMRRVLREIRLLSNTSNLHNYQYSEQDVDKMFGSIIKQVKEARAKFDTGREREASFDF